MRGAVTGCPRLRGNAAEKQSAVRGMSLREFYQGGAPRLSEMRIKVRKAYIRKVRKNTAE